MPSRRVYALTIACIAILAFVFQVTYPEVPITSVPTVLALAGLGVAFVLGWLIDVVWKWKKKQNRN